ncbi:matrixin family metalloprotease [Candidatus Nitrotoga arctica]|uniref:matrixin family metalloprotease n=1 Tax=Candidatus Nitrotoga arctica TaxID=453162 RepID=UPI001EFA98AE|nr:matrixin family metalloprotease [Candidatus Nitrotoga arctica]
MASIIVFFIGSSFSFAQHLISVATPSGQISILPEVAKLGAGCPKIGSISVNSGVVIDAADICEPARWRNSNKPMATCPARSFPVLGVLFQGRRDWVLAESVVLSKQHFHLRLFGAMEDAHGDRQDIVAIKRVEWCTANASSPSRPELPSDACREPRQFAVAFDYGAPLNNKIFINGFSFYVRVAGHPIDGFDIERAGEDIRSSFGRALTIWTSGLQDNNAMLTPTIRTFIRSRTSTTAGGYTLLTSPQVVQLYCPHAATFIVELNFGGDGTFPNSSLFLTLAKSRLVGRTISLNMRDVACFRTMPEMTNDQVALRDDNCVNLLPVFTHELGHAFGIEHIPSASGWALMNPVLSENATMPTRLDVNAFVSALERSVTGASPGELEFREASGLQAPSDWSFGRK